MGDGLEIKCNSYKRERKEKTSLRNIVYFSEIIIENG